MRKIYFVSYRRNYTCIDKRKERREKKRRKEKVIL
jgi:hypothetical protein